MVNAVGENSVSVRGGITALMDSEPCKRSAAITAIFVGTVFLISGLYQVLQPDRFVPGQHWIGFVFSAAGGFLLIGGASTLNPNCLCSRIN